MPRVSPTKKAAVVAGSNARRPSITAASAVRHVFAILAVLIVVGCGGGGCSSCACAGVTPLPDGFAVADRIENAGSVRLTESGFAFLESNFGALAGKLLSGMGTGGIVTFELPQSNGTAGPLKYTICPNGSDPNGNPKICTAEIDVGNAGLKIAPEAPNDIDIRISGTLPIRIQDLQVRADLSICAPTLNVALNGDGACPGGNFDQFPLNVDISVHIEEDPDHAVRIGYSTIEIKQIIDGDAAKTNLKDSLHICGNANCTGLCCITDPCACALGELLDIGALKDAIVNALFPEIEKALKKQIDAQLCLKANATVSPTCPTGTLDDDGVCRFADGTCASTLAGTEGHIDLSGLLASISPGTKGGLDFLFAAGGPSDRDDGSGAAWGDLNTIENGATLGFFGGAEPLPVSKCVKLSELSLPTGIPIPAELLTNTLAGWPTELPGPHFGLAVSERYANYALNGLYNSGLLCVGISTENVAQLNSGVLGLLASSSKDLGLQRETQQVALVVRPGKPPQITFGSGTDAVTDPVIRITMNEASFDFYFFSLDRYVRFMTATFDLDVPVNLVVTPQGLTPVLDKLGVTNGKVTNAELLKEDPAILAGSIADLIGSQVGQALGGGIAPVDLSSMLGSLGLNLVIPETEEGKGSPGLRKLTKANSKGEMETYLGLFAAFEVPGAPIMQADTSADLLGKKVDPAGVKLLTIQPGNAPSVRLHLGSTLDDGAKAVEYSYRVDTGLWHPFTRQRMLDIQDSWLRVQGKHVIQVRSRVVGQPMSLDATPAEVTVVVDVDAPTIAMREGDDGKLTLDVNDKISGEQTVVRVKLDNLGWSAWKPAAEVVSLEVGDAAEVTVEAKDEEGNVGSASQPLLRGRATDAAAGCGCAVAGADETPRSAAWLFGIGLVGALSRLGRKRVSSVVQPRTLRRLVSAVALPVSVLAVTSSWAGCNCGVETEGVAGSTTTGTPGCTDCALLPGLVGAYTSVAVDGATVWVAGYSEANWDDGYTWGDLVVGKWDGKKVDWKSIDGVPSEPKPDPMAYDAEGFRGGQTEPGEDVGLWTSIALDSAGLPGVAYYDRSNKALKFAKYDGKAWAVSTVEGKQGADIGRYAKVVATKGGFAIAYLSIEGGGNNGAAISGVRVATSASENPTSWTFEDAVVDKNTPCRAPYCPTGTVCLATTQLCTTPLAETACDPVCASGTACADLDGTPTCTAKIDANKVDAYPDAVGLYIAAAADPKGNIGIAYYDRPRGNLVVAAKAAGAWTTQIIDGEADGKDTGDMGIGATLFIDASNDWHIAYVDGNAEGLRYVKVTGGSKAGVPELVDEGIAVGGVAFGDGQHLVGDDANIAVASSGEVRISYQDATVGKLRFAVGAPASSGHTWTVKVVEQPGFAGAFSHVVDVEGKVQLANWWRTGGGKVEGDVAFVSP